MFPSPIGELHFSMVITSLSVSFVQFPSPIGELHFSIIYLLSLENTKPSFRPLSGSYISQYFTEVLVRIRWNGFRPLSGSYISQCYIHQDSTSILMAFPSPIGELHFSIESSETLPRCSRRFRPLSGSYISQWAGGKTAKEAFNEVSVPYRGATFLNLIELCFALIFSASCFRPLSGSYISQYHPRNPMSCLGRIGGLRGKSNFIEMQPFWKVKNSHKSSI